MAYIGEIKYTYEHYVNRINVFFRLFKGILFLDPTTTSYLYLFIFQFSPKGAFIHQLNYVAVSADDLAATIVCPCPVIFAFLHPEKKLFRPTGSRSAARLGFSLSH
jgi:hypothetical protein